eukprot:TRINITY_DN19390_c0_g2_i1.p1 TRINITY_DN19390_c0_g2~~TRINITY_DN19390_c0_g2_i1.p1  ORF type:complete len:554 (+),score=75.04 TRINITY_DN19390_c0_g2_i1:61-1722(+)
MADVFASEEGLLILVAACVVGQAAVVNWVGLYNLCLSSVSSTSAFLQRVWRAGAEETVEDQDELLRQVTAWQLRFFEKNIIACQGCLGLFTLQLAFNAWRGYEQDGTGLRDRILMISYLLVLILQKLISRFGEETRRLRTLQACAAYYIVHIGSITIFAWVMDESWIVVNDYILMALRVCFVLCILQKPWIVLGCFVYSSVYLVKVYSVDEALLVPAIVRQVVNACICLLASEVSRRFISMQVKVNQEAQIMRHAAERLLDLLCDAVAHVDQHLRFVSHSAKLAGTLILASHRNLAGSRLEEFLDESSAESLRQVLQSAARNTEPTAGAINLLMRDSTGSMLKFEAFYIHFRDFGRHSYLVGFRECAESMFHSVAPLTSRASREVTVDIENRPRAMPVISSLADGQQELDSDTTSSSQATTVGGNFIFPTRRPTDTTIVRQCLVALSKSYNYQKPIIDSCCLYNGALEALKEQLETLQLSACQSTFMLHTQWQCHACGIMQAQAPTEETCHFCAKAQVADPGRGHGSLPSWARGLDKQPKPFVSITHATTVDI